MRKFAFSFVICILVGFVGCQKNLNNVPLPKNPIKEEIEFTSILFFVENAHPKTGLVRDFSENFKENPSDNRVASMASTGFGLAVIANAAERGLIEKQYAEDYVLKVLRFAENSVPRRHGWFLHWVDWETGERAWGSEFSTIDSALFLAGALYAAAIFPGGEIEAITQRIYTETDFLEAMTDGGAKPDKRTLSMAWSPETGYTPAQWDMFGEQMILLILGLGHPTRPLPSEAWLAFHRNMKKGGNVDMMGLEEALFVHQYSQVFLDFRAFDDGYANYFENAKRISLFHRDLIEREKNIQTLQNGFWGYSAGQAPANGYRVFSGLNYSSIVCIGCTLASAMFLPETVLSDAQAWKNSSHQQKIWGRYGFVDSLDVDQNWYSSQVLGITVGPAFLSLANLSEDTSVWRVFMQIPEIQAGLTKARLARSHVTSQVRSNTRYFRSPQAGPGNLFSSAHHHPL